MRPHLGPVMRRGLEQEITAVPISDTNNRHDRGVGKNTSFSLDEHYSAFIDDEVASGRYRRSTKDLVLWPRPRTRRTLGSY